MANEKTNDLELAHRLELLADDMYFIADMTKGYTNELAIYSAELRNEAQITMDWANALRQKHDKPNLPD